MFGVAWLRTPTAKSASPLSIFKEAVEELRDDLKPVVTIIRVMLIGLEGLVKLVLNQPLVL